jgi:hypothetical protein
MEIWAWKILTWKYQPGNLETTALTGDEAHGD